jgi:outer membrane protein
MEVEEAMKKFVSVAVIGVFLLFGSISAVYAQEKAPELKIGIVNIYKAVNESEQGKKAKTELESIIKSKQSSLESKGRRIEQLRSEIERQGDVLSAEAKKNKADEYERLTREYQRNAADSQNEVRKKEAELTGRIIKSIRTVVLAIAEEEKYTIILERADGVVLFVDPGLDITNVVISRLDSSSSSSSKPRKKKK